jgi:hypothetical protein
VLKGDAHLSFATAELTLNVGFVAGRVRLLRLMHRVADAGLVTSMLAGLPDPPLRARFRDRLLLRLAEPVTADGMAIFPMCWETDAPGSRPLTMADVRLILRTGGAGQTFIRLAGTVWQPGPAEPARRAVKARAEDWLSRLAEVMTSAQTAG